MTRSQLAAAGALHTCQVERGKDKAWLGFRDSQYGHQNFPVYPRFGWIKQPFGAIQSDSPFGDVQRGTGWHPLPKTKPSLGELSRLTKGGTPWEVWARHILLTCSATSLTRLSDSLPYSIKDRDAFAVVDQIKRCGPFLSQSSPSHQPQMTKRMSPRTKLLF